MYEESPLSHLTNPLDKYDKLNQLNFHRNLNNDLYLRDIVFSICKYIY